MRPTVRPALIVLSGLMMAVMVVEFGREMDRGSISLAECVQEPARCAGEELYLGYARVLDVSERDVHLRSWMGPVSIRSWPNEAPLPWPGLSVSIIGTYAGGREIVPIQVKQHPYRWLKESTGIVMLIGWFGALTVWTRRRWREGGSA